MIKKFIVISALTIFCLADSMASEAWNPKSNFGGVGRHRGTGVSIGTKGYIGLGHYNGTGLNVMFSDWWEYDPSTNSWSQKADYPFPTYAAASFSIGMKCYVGTGVSAGNQFYCFDPIANTWTGIADVPIGSTDQNGFSVHDKGYYLYSNELYEYDPLLNTWAAKSLGPFGWGSWPSTFVIDDKAYVKTGAGFYEYKQSTDQWIQRAPFPGLATGGSASFAVNGKGYIICGYIGWLSELSDEVWEYDPALNTWTLLSDFPGNGRRFSSSFNIGNKGYLGIGTTGTNMRDFWEFDEVLAISKLSELFQVSEPYPNPSSDFVNFNIQSNQTNVHSIQVKLFDVAGREVYSEQFQQSTLQISKEKIGQGLFIYQILADNQKIKTGKLIFE